MSSSKYVEKDPSKLFEEKYNIESTIKLVLFILGIACLFFGLPLYFYYAEHVKNQCVEDKQTYSNNTVSDPPVNTDSAGQDSIQDHNKDCETAFDNYTMAGKILTGSGLVFILISTIMCACIVYKRKQELNYYFEQ
jgi:hypothetical protein